MKLFIISNRLPLKARKENGKFWFSRSEGGLATGLDSLHLSVEKCWIGWPGVDAGTEEEKESIRTYMKKFNFYPVFLTPEQVQKYYEGYSNSTVWPLCHYFSSYIEYESVYWRTYREVNELFCQEALKQVSPEDIVWVQDYQLMLLPGLLRQHFPLISIGYFHHIPFPSYELFRMLPGKLDIINGLLGADLIAFHTPDYMRYFMAAAQRIAGIFFRFGEVQLMNRVVRVDAFPMGINYSLYYHSSRNKAVQECVRKLSVTLGKYKIILTVDRLDYSKGIIHRLKGFDLFLEAYPEYRGEVSLVMVIVPSRDQVEKYADLKVRIDEMIGTINGKYATLDWTPIHYLYRGLPFEELVALYHMADIALVTPLRDGMNLVAKEYVAAKREKPGVLILSEMAGAAIELPEAILINPNDLEEIKGALYKALHMPETEQLKKLHRMQQVISRQTVDKWAADFVEELHEIRKKNNVLYEKMIRKQTLADIRTAYLRAVHRLIVLDYDGTLVGFAEEPQDAVPTLELNGLLKSLVKDAKNKIVICSGRDHETLEKWFGYLPLEMAAEHGAFYKSQGKWEEKIQGELWNDEIIHILQQMINKTPGAMLEVKRTALVWHYRNVNHWLAAVRERQLLEQLQEPCRRLGLQIMRGSKIVEIKSPLYTKGSVVKELIQKERFDFMMAIGDDTTDEDMFRAMPSWAVTVKVGNVSGNARYNLYSQSYTLPFLKALL